MRISDWRSDVCSSDLSLRCAAASYRCSRRLPVVPHYSGPLLTRPIAEAMLAARDAGAGEWTGSLDLGRSNGSASLQANTWQWQGQHHPYPHKLKDRTIYYRDGDEFAPVARFAGSLIKLVPNEWRSEEQPSELQSLMRN